MGIYDIQCEQCLAQPGQVCRGGIAGTPVGAHLRRQARAVSLPDGRWWWMCLGLLRNGECGWWLDFEGWCEGCREDYTSDPDAYK